MAKDVCRRYPSTFYSNRLCAAVALSACEGQRRQRRHGEGSAGRRIGPDRRRCGGSGSRHAALPRSSNGVWRTALTDPGASDPGARPRPLRRRSLAFVVAETLAQAKDAAEMIEVKCDACFVGSTRAVKDGAPQVWDDNPGNLWFDQMR